MKSKVMELIFSWLIITGIAAISIFIYLRLKPASPPEKFRFQTVSIDGSVFFVRGESQTGEIDVMYIGNGKRTWLRVMQPESVTKTWVDVGNFGGESANHP